MPALSAAGSAPGRPPMEPLDPEAERSRGIGHDPVGGGDQRCRDVLGDGQMQGIEGTQRVARQFG